MIKAIWNAVRGCLFARCIRQEKTVETDGSWKTMIGTRNIIRDKVVNEINERLGQRPVGGRDPGRDDQLFSPLSDATAIAITYDEYQLAISMFYECYKLARDYESQHGVEVHKGAMAFNVGIALLRSHDFPAAMHYFELSQHETRLSYGQSNWGVFDFELFDRSYWRLIDLFETKTPLSYYQTMWGVAYGKSAAQDDWKKLSEHSKLLYIMVGAERIRYSQLKSQPNWSLSDSIGLCYWNLIADLARLLETELRHKGIKGNGLRGMVLSGVTSPHDPAFRTTVNALHTTLPVNNPADFNAVFPTIKSAIQSATESPERKVAHAAYLAGIVRNQVQHQVDTRMVVYTDRDAAVFTVDVLLSLCRIREWVT